MPHPRRKKRRPHPAKAGFLPGLERLARPAGRARNARFLGIERRAVDALSSPTPVQDLPTLNLLMQQFQWLKPTYCYTWGG